MHVHEYGSGMVNEPAILLARIQVVWPELSLLQW